MNIDWENPSSSITQNFTVREALWLPKWNRMATEVDGLTLEIKANLILLFNTMEVVRAFLDKPINVHVAYRPKLYNKLIGGATNSAHMYGMAVDWDAGISCDVVRKLIVPKLDEWNLRCERLPVGSNWVHLDSRQPGPSGRYFVPKN